MELNGWSLFRQQRELLINDPRNSPVKLSKPTERNCSSVSLIFALTVWEFWDPSIHLLSTNLSCARSQGVESLGERLSTREQTHSHLRALSPNLHVCGRKPEHPEDTHTDIWPWPDSPTGPCWSDSDECWATVLPWFLLFQNNLSFLVSLHLSCLFGNFWFFPPTAPIARLAIWGERISLWTSSLKVYSFLLYM